MRASVKHSDRVEKIVVLGFSSPLLFSSSDGTASRAGRQNVSVSRPTRQQHPSVMKRTLSPFFGPALAQNAYGGSDMDSDSLVRVNMAGLHKPQPPSDAAAGANVGAIVGGVLGGIVVLGLVAFAVNAVMKRRGNNAPPLGGGAMYSSGGFMKMSD